jgi:DNA-binding response OmpR family regulator
MNKSKKILLIEDEKPMAKALDHKLTAENFEITVAIMVRRVWMNSRRDHLILLLLI